MTDTPQPTLILASRSSIRRQLLTGAGLTVTVQSAPVDERAIEQELTRTRTMDPAALAQALAIAKADAVSAANPNALVIGADQVLDHQGVILHKAADAAEAEAKLARLQGSTHRLTSAAALVRGGETLWAGADAAMLTMRALDERARSAYLAQAGDAATQSVGAYRLEELGAGLFERIEGDYFTILGLPLLALLAALRMQGIDPIAGLVTDTNRV